MRNDDEFESKQNVVFFLSQKRVCLGEWKSLVFFSLFFCNFFDQSISFWWSNKISLLFFVESSVEPAFFYWSFQLRILHKHTRTKNNLIITNMSAALTSSTFVGAKVSVAKTTTASKRVAFSVQANASGPKKVRIPIPFFFVRLKIIIVARFRRVVVRPNFAFRPTRKWDCARFFSETSMKRSCASFGNDRCACIPMRKFTSNAITRFFERFNLRASPFHDARPISNFILFSSFVYLIRSASSVVLSRRIDFTRRSRPKDNEICFASFLREKTKNKISLCCCVSALSNNINNNNNWQNRWYLLLFTSQQGTKSKGGQAGVGYKGSTEAGSAPKRRDGKAGYVYSLGVRNGKANVDEYSPIYSPEEFKTDGDKYEGNLLYWAATLAGIIGSGALAIYLTSAL